MASLLPGKSHEDVRHRYQRLVYDVHKIENAVPVRNGKEVLLVAIAAEIKPFDKSALTGLMSASIKVGLGSAGKGRQSPPSEDKCRVARTPRLTFIEAEPKPLEFED